MKNDGFLLLDTLVAIFIVMIFCTIILNGVEIIKRIDGEINEISENIH